jgi:hypothetical protein
MDMETHSREFALVKAGANPTVAFLRRTIVLAGLVAYLAFIVAHVTGNLSSQGVLGLGAFVLAAAVFLVWEVRREYQGNVVADAERLVVSTGAGRQSYRWSDVNGVRVITLSEIGGFSRLLARIAKLDSQRRLVEVTLHKRPRVSPIANRAGTDVWGIPRLGSRLHLYLTEPEEFARFAGTRLSG